MTWVPTDDGRTRCDRHKITFGERETCARCVDDPGPPVIEQEDAAAPAPDGCISSEEHEKRLVDLAEYVEHRARALCKGRGRINYATAGKLFEIAIKAYRAAGEYTQTRERREHVRRLERRRREMQRGRGGSN